MKLNVQCVSLGPTRSISVVSLAWFNGPTTSNRPSLAICYETGKFQIMRNENDDREYSTDVCVPHVRCTHSFAFQFQSSAIAKCKRWTASGITTEPFWRFAAQSQSPPKRTPIKSCSTRPMEMLVTKVYHLPSNYPGMVIRSKLNSFIDRYFSFRNQNE